MLPENRTFLVRGDDGLEYGPVDLAELREWVQENRAGLGTTVRLDEPGTAWQPWQSYPELVALLAEANISSPVPGVPGLVLAPLWKRMLALVADLLLSSFLAFPIVLVVIVRFEPDWADQVMQMVFQPQSTMSSTLYHYMIINSLISDTILVLYMAGFHAAHGRTPAKSVLYVKVVDQYGQKPSFVKTFLRALVLIFSLNLYGIPLAYAFFNPQRRAFHDFVAGTYVVEE